MATPLRMALSHLVGWAADLKLPTPLRSGVFRTYARLAGADLAECHSVEQVLDRLSAVRTDQTAWSSYGCGGKGTRSGWSG